ncbi:MAG: S49 family peptidase [Desulfobacteraceae bacterium]|nr:S49 family peptidase [Desulfobacteraceae bacterium]
MPKAMLARIASRLLNTPLMITPGKLETILQALGPRIGLGEIDTPAAVTDFSRRPQYREYSGDGIGLIPVMGPLAYNLSFEDAVCSDIVSYRDIRSMFREALDDPQITAILFAFDSPGGEVAGVFDLADEIYQARSVKPIYSIADEAAFSAAYALAGAAAEIFLPRTGGVGSIGVIAQHVDQSAKDAKDGFEFTPVFAGARKNDFSPHQALSPEGLERLQALVDADYRIFVDTVARNRGLSTDAVSATEAAIFKGEAAIVAGLADKIMNFEQAVAYIEAKSRNGGQTMKIFGFGAKVQPTAAAPESSPAGALPEEVVDLQAVLEQARSEVFDAGKAEALQAARETVKAEEIARVSAIMDSVQAVGKHLPDPFSFAVELVKEGASAQQASDRIIKAVADKSAADAPEITSTVTPTGTGEPNPLLADARKRAEAAKKKGA